jgi:hypothetical protein
MGAHRVGIRRGRQFAGAREVDKRKVERARFTPCDASPEIQLGVDDAELLVVSDGIDRLVPAARFERDLDRPIELYSAKIKSGQKSAQL